MTNSVTQLSLRFHGNLNDFLPYNRRSQTFAQSVDGAPAVKDVVESFGVPHTEIDAILVNGSPVGFSYQVCDGDQLAVYPIANDLNLPPAAHLQPAPPAEPRFILDVHLGRLAAYLRLLGFDTLYENDCDDPVLAERSRDEQRILLTRDIGLLKRNAVQYGYFVRETQPERQVEEVARRYNLIGLVAPFSRCLRCNGLLTSIPKEDVADRVPPNVWQAYGVFRLCPACGNIYWKGTHYQRMQQLVNRLTGEQQAPHSEDIAANE